MMTDAPWIGMVDHRISAAVVFFFLMMLLRPERQKPRFWLRAAASFLLMAAANWLIRYCAEDVFRGNVYLEGLGYALQVLALFLLFLLCYRWCYSATPVQAVYTAILALAIFKISWNFFKAFGSLFELMNGIVPWSAHSPFGSMVSYVVYCVICLICWAIYDYEVHTAALHTELRLIVTLAGVFVLIQMMLEFCGHVFTANTSALFLYYFCSLLYSIINFASLLLMAMLDDFRHENRSMHDFISNKMRYYEMSRDGIASLQEKCHDLKHQIAAIRSEAGKESFTRYLDELQDSIDAYSAVIDCGNETVNIVLTEKNFLCLSRKVKFSYLIDGGLFSFLSEREIYSLFGNALDNALEAVMKVEDPERRFITLKSNRRGNLVVMQVENTYAGEVRMENGLPPTTKSGSGHGFGVRSIQRLAEKHGGEISMRAENGVFRLSVLLDPGFSRK